MATQLPWFPFYVDDYLHDTYDLSPCEHGVYLLLLSRFWISGPLRDDLDVLCRMAAGAQPQMVREILERFWTLTGQGWVNARMQAEMAKSLDTRKKRAEAANSMWKKKLGKSTEAPMQEHMPGICYPQSQLQVVEDASAQPTTHDDENKKKPTKRGTRFNLESLPDDWLSWAEAEFPGKDAQDQFDRFKDYWSGIAGQKGTKLDWSGTWRNWCRSARDWKQSQQQPPRRRLIDAF